MSIFFLGLTTSFILAVVLMPILIRILRRTNTNQPLLEYVTMHEKKVNTPTMGGICFLLIIPLMTLVFTTSNRTLILMSLIIMLAYGLVGLLDDFLKVSRHNNGGLKAYQKIIFQFIIAVVVALFSYYSNSVGSKILIPFSKISVDLGWFYIPFAIFFFLAVTNAVNLTDGLDGLASGVSLSYLLPFSVIMLLSPLNYELSNIVVGNACVIGVLLAYILFNSFPASVFMGDTGSLALGGYIASVTLFTRNPLIFLVLGIMFVVSCVSVVIQVLVYKMKKKRVFLMAPFHHHLEKKGLSETKIVVLYVVITLILGTISSFLTALII